MEWAGALNLSVKRPFLIERLMSLRPIYVAARLDCVRSGGWEDLAMDGPGFGCVECGEDGDDADGYTLDIHNGCG